MDIIEITKNNEKQYLGQIAELEQIVLEAMKKEGRDGQLFATGKEDISEYIHSEENTVMVATDEDGNVKAVTYVTQGQKPFTYNDITKYFKFGSDYKQYVRTQYKNGQEYKRDLLDIYKIKIQGFEYAKRRILQEHPEMKNLQEFLEQEISENGFHEKSELREKINRYMSEYILQNFDESVQKKYEQFYWITTEDISEEFGKEIKDTNIQIQEYERFMQSQLEYEEILGKSKLKIYEKPTFQSQKYYTANTNNAVELDTYITSPNNRDKGLAKIIVFEAIKKHMRKHFENPENKEIFLCSTLHRDNLLSKYVSEFFGLTDSLFVNRRQGRDREVHICRILREEAMDYLVSMTDKIAVLYGYNPYQKSISITTRKKVLEQQLRYEENEHKRLITAKATNKKFNGINVKFIESKLQKVKRLKKAIQELDQYRGGENYGE